MRISWTPPDDGGVEMLAYRIVTQQNDGVFVEQEFYCDGNDATIIQDQYCLIPSQILHAFNFELAWAQSVNAKVTAYNIKGWSEESAVGNGGVILWGPSAPTNIALNSALTTRFNAAFTWSDVLDTRGTPVIDY